MIHHLRNTLLILSSITTMATSVYTSEYPPQAHQLDDTYTFDQYLTHFNKAYANPTEYNHRKQLFHQNIQTILRHNDGRMNEHGHIITKGGKGWVMGVNQFTDLDHTYELEKLFMGYNKLQHPAWRSQLDVADAGAGADRAYSMTERRERRKLGGIDTGTYQVRFFF